MKKLSVILFFPLAFLLCPHFCEAQYKVLLNFNDTNGKNPYLGAPVVSGKTIYGTTTKGGANGDGCVYSLDTNGRNYKDLLDFNISNGSDASAPLLLAGNKLYGTTTMGGLNAKGCIFSLDTNGGGYKDLLDFNGVNGSRPYGGVQLCGNRLFGMTAYGGANSVGVIYSIDTNGTGFKTLLVFNGVSGSNPDGEFTILGNRLFGMTFAGGTFGEGDIFVMDTSGALISFNYILNFSGGNGSYPLGDLTFNNGKFFGMTEEGGINAEGNIFTIDSSGNNFKDLMDFNLTDGGLPYGSLVLSNGKLYGMAQQGGLNSDGLIFSIDSTWTSFTDLYDFNGTKGSVPYGTLALSNGSFYGVAYSGGTHNDGVVFRWRDSSIETSANTVAAKTQKVKVFPNPSNGLFTVVCHSDLPAGREISQSIIEVYNVLGEKVYSQSTTHQSPITIDLSTQPNGIYLYRLISADGSLTGEGKLVIQR
ncbi:MAG TPA: choice-of-anchor tandem repeat GloVer-containing protein [Bacteroidia bacterium]|nr:choice-of-anchor tandem repeat GloVer-containing protein [Bacteroidia bacterium]